MSKRVVLLAVDGLDWAELRAGIKADRLPNFRAMMEQGAHAEVGVKCCVPGLVGSEEGMNSPTLWTTVATGQYYFQHGVYDFSNALASADRPPLFASSHVRSPRLWDILTHKDLPSLVVGYYVTYPAYPIKGLMVSDMFGEVASDKVVYPPKRREDFTQLLGAKDYDAYLRTTGILGTEAGIRETRRIDMSDAELRNRVREVLEKFTGLKGSEIEDLLDAPDSQQNRRMIEYRLIYPFIRDQRLHRLFLGLLGKEDWRFATLYYRIVDFVSHGFWTGGHKLPKDFVRCYGQLIGKAYAWIDDCIGQVRERLGKDDRLIVLSDHGFSHNQKMCDFSSCSDISTFSYGQHAEPAVLLVTGGSRTGPVDDVTLLDIAPTIVDFFGLPQAESFDGGPVPGLLDEKRPRSAARVQAYPYTPPADTGEMTELEQEAMRRRLAALGYIE